MRRRVRPAPCSLRAPRRLVRRGARFVRGSTTTPAQGILAVMRLSPSLLLLLAACLPPGGTGPLPDALVPASPALVDLTVACDVEAGAWTVEVGTDAWAGGAVLLWTENGTYVERHDTFRSTRAAQDGSSDRLRNDVAIVTDFRPAENGRTAFACTVLPSALLWVLDLGGAPSDCRQVGPHTAPLLVIEGVPACPEVYALPSDTDASE